MKRKTKICDYCGRDTIIFKNIGRTKQCLNCWKRSSRPIKGKKVETNTKSERKVLIDKIDKNFSYLLRFREEVKRGISNKVLCYTCDTVLDRTQAQCGHFVSRENDCTRWLLDNCRVQCYTCNVTKYGNLKEFEKRLESDIPGITAQLRALGNSRCSFGYNDLVSIYEQVKSDLKKVMNGN